jgi:hypothetical protein
MADMDFGEMFHNFPMEERMRRCSGVEVEVQEKGGKTTKLFVARGTKKTSIVKIVKLHTIHQVTIAREIIQAVLNQWNLRLECFY